MWFSQPKMDFFYICYYDDAKDIRPVGSWKGYSPPDSCLETISFFVLQEVKPTSKTVETDYIVNLRLV